MTRSTAGGPSPESRLRAELVLRLQGVSHRYVADGEFALRDVTVEIARGSVTAILGPSGSGKTTLLRIAAGLLSPSRGHAWALGHRVDARSLRDALRGRIGYIPQQLGLVRNRTAMENALMGALPRTATVTSLLGSFAPADVDLAKETLRRVGLAAKAEEKVFRLSGGQRQRVAIARTLVQQSEVILADEFVSDLDEETARAVMEAILELREEGTTLVMALHDVRLASEYADRAVVLLQGMKVAELEGSALASDPLGVSASLRMA